MQTEILATVLDWMNFQATIKCHYICKIDIAESWGWLIYQTTTGKWRQTRKWFLYLIKSLTLKKEIIEVFFCDFWNNKQISNCFFKISIGGDWRSYQATMGNWHQIWIWFAGNFKEFRVQMEILAGVFVWICKQQLNLSLLL